MLNTAGARNADEAVRIAKIGKAAGFGWLKIEVHPDARYLLPDPVETLAAVLANTAVAAAGDPVKMAEAFKLAVRAAELAIEARPPRSSSTAREHPADVAQFTLSDGRSHAEVFAAIRANGQEVVFKNWDNRI